MFKRSKLLILVAPILLAGCGEGYDLVRTADMFPYGNQRTAGTGVAYVLAKMMPERELNLQTVERPHQPQALEETQDILNTMDHDVEAPQPADQIFIDQQKK
ncbi:MAG: hypothetical protein KDJ75_07065 [Alphaproteobacteria bacterium]|nr:hypothetical protein [Alphaproteobacteria bacterium]